MAFRGVLVLVLVLGGAVGAAVQRTELNEAKVGSNLIWVHEKMRVCESVGVFFSRPI